VQTPAVAAEAPHVPYTQCAGGPSGRAIDPHPSSCLSAPGGCAHAVESAQSTLGVGSLSARPAPHAMHTRRGGGSTRACAVLVTARAATTAARLRAEANGWEACESPAAPRPSDHTPHLCRHHAPPPSTSHVRERTRKPPASACPQHQHGIRRWEQPHLEHHAAVMHG
jgi:hypothetical protein